ncbi:hypothetical protein M2137_000865 [Parabacteroides sp. PFB2-10]|uniref:DUF6055 domain-containing protein n=1 Tax=Parabacteroides sp. PFB2-10 TaxID=1742405 RepID=UPI00247403D3|nr:DUF6055 domain-containing protein [Parabacteroides sp. PFB2-10]MDH6312102.1 hypothetical protein [Parabacteroides sp. PFB2-10]MDL2245308.1 DUF6055 domain-containing protein [Parabacteroides sp. OttesenSCG-928-J18]
MKKLKKLHHILILELLLIALGIQSCKNDDPILVDSVKVEKSEIIVQETGGVTEISFTASGKWTSEVSADWIELDRKEGVGAYLTKVNVTVKKNEIKEPRSAIIYIHCGTSKGKITITQKENTAPIGKEIDPKDIPDYEKYHKPGEFSNMNMLLETSKWSFFRYKQSEHFFVFWEAGFGNNPNSSDVPGELRVDIDDLLVKAEQFYKTNIEKLKFANTGSGASNLDKYKMQIYMHYTTEWMAYGSGYDDVIGALWVNPSTCHPVGSTIAHEIGHSFQYQVYCDKVAQGAPKDFAQGFRYGYEGSNGGCAFWEQCAQWQSFQDYPNELFGYHVSVWEANCHRSFEHEWMRYASYWLPYYWAQKHGIESVAEIWKQSVKPEDALSAYMRLFCNNKVETLYEDMYDYATRMVTYDLDVVRDYRPSSAGNYKTKLFSAGDYYQVAYASCPGTTGFNVIALNVPDAGTTIKADFVGLQPGSVLAADDPGSMIDGDGNVVGTTRYYNNHHVKAGWRYGFVAIVNGKARYEPMHKESESQITYTIPANTTRLYLVVQGAPAQYVIHGWNDKESDDAQWPYKVKFEGTDLLGNFNIDPDADIKDISFTYDLICDATKADYILGSIDLQGNGDLQKLLQAFVLPSQVFSGNTLPIASGNTVEPKEGKIVLGLLQSDGSYSYSYTANVGFYCTAAGNQGSWGNNDPLWFEYDKETFIITYGHKPGFSVAGKKYTLKPTLVYTKDNKQYKATFVLNMQF